MSGPSDPRRQRSLPSRASGVLGKPFHLLQRSAPSRQEKTPLTSERETCQALSPPGSQPGSLPALTRPFLASRRCLQRHLLRAGLPVAGPRRCEWAVARAGCGRGVAGPGRGWAEPWAGCDRPRPAVYHVIFIYCAVKGHRGFQFFYLPYFEK